MKEDLKEVALTYFKIFSQKNINGLRPMFSENITLRDWDIHAVGIEDVLKANSNIFNNVNTIKVIPENIILENNFISAELKIIVNDEEELKVVDLIEFNESGKITSIKAFKG
tara:strand:- start:95 stop:430 length:336 start_codon:yes stop_codon:yes gene_type:complete